VCASLPSCSTQSTSLGDVKTASSGQFRISEQARHACPDLDPLAGGDAATVARAMAADGKQYRECQAGHAEAVGAFDLLAKGFDELLERLNGIEGGKKK
jgi:hypothetical protein